MLYLDASVIVALHVMEAHSLRAKTWMSQQNADSFAISEWSVVEFMSALSLKVRTGQISSEERGRAVAAFQEFTYPTIVRLDIRGTDFRVASNMVGQPETGLRASDALHLAIALRHEASICTLDKTQFAAAQTLNVRGHLLG